MRLKITVTICLSRCRRRASAFLPTALRSRVTTLKRVRAAGSLLLPARQGCVERLHRDERVADLLAALSRRQQDRLRLAASRPEGAGQAARARQARQVLPRALLVLHDQPPEVLPLPRVEHRDVRQQLRRVELEPDVPSVRLDEVVLGVDVLGGVHVVHPHVYVPLLAGAQHVLVHVAGELRPEPRLGVPVPLELSELQQHPLFAGLRRQQPHPAVQGGHQHQRLPPVPVHPGDVGAVRPAASSVSAVGLPLDRGRFRVVQHDPAARGLHGEHFPRRGDVHVQDWAHGVERFRRARKRAPRQPLRRWRVRTIQGVALHVPVRERHQHLVGVELRQCRHGCGCQLVCSTEHEVVRASVRVQAPASQISVRRCGDDLCHFSPSLVVFDDIDVVDGGDVRIDRHKRFRRDYPPLQHGRYRLLRCCRLELGREGHVALLRRKPVACHVHADQAPRRGHRHQRLASGKRHRRDGVRLLAL
ncbi:cupin domain-containing protein [Babesia caballi]|uniref:Cupin domain-containing protein n=1 Tax=Babesia caballi TaxID=5871 RepID=A0AAV4LL46_BABCB|nr:cupin domain-containing protein [Babesia caballi]